MKLIKVNWTPAGVVKQFLDAVDDCNGAMFRSLERNPIIVTRISRIINYFLMSKKLPSHDKHGKW
ncbi:MAG: hypothetical protein LBB18_00990 [Puniceicoccales bacterium]|jgi:hypothetical protein|nr:hypothetical protein [Puniceicoccales bacterium]